MKRANITTYDVFVANFNKNLQNDAIEKKVSKQFTQYGETKGIFIKENSQGKFGVVKYLSEPDADRAVSEANGVLMDGIPILVKRMERRSNKPVGAGGSAGGGVTGGTWITAKDSSQKNQFGKNPDIVPAVEPVASSSPGPDGEAMMVTYIETPTLLWCQELTLTQQNEVETMRNKLKEICPTAPKLHGRPELSKVYGAMFSEDGEWYRCQVKSISSSSAEKVRIQYIDFGNCEEVISKDLVELPADLTSNRPQALKIMLHNTRYIAGKEREARRHLEELIMQEQVIVSPTFRLPDGTGQFAQVHSAKVGNVNQYLIDNGLAMVKPPKQQQPPPQHADLTSQFHIGEGGGYSSFPSRGFGGGDVGGYPDVPGPFPQGLKSGGSRGFKQMGGMTGRHTVGDQDPMRFATPRFGPPGPVRGGSKMGGGDKGSLLQDSSGQMVGQLSAGIGPGFADLKMDSQNKQRALEKATSELASERLRVKEYQGLVSRMEENSIANQLKTTVGLVDKVRRLRSQFSCGERTTLDEAIELACSDDKLTENSVTSLSPLMTTLSTYRKMQQDICQLSNKQELSEEKLEERDALRKTLYQQMTDCISEMEGIPFSERAHQITQCTQKLMKHYDNFFNLPVEPLTDFKTTVTQYQDFKIKKQKEFEESQKCTDQMQKTVQDQLTGISKSLSLSPEDEGTDCDLDLLAQLKQYCVCMQQEISSKNVEASQDGNYIASLVKSVHSDLKAEIVCVNNFMGWESEFRNMQSTMGRWLDDKPSIDKLLENRQLLKTLKSKLRHKLADKHDAEENEDKEMLEEVQKEVEDIQTEIHNTLVVEETELAELASLVDSHFPEFLARHPDIGLDMHLKYKGVVKSSHEISHYNLTPVPGANGRLFFSKFANQDIIVMECLLSDGHHLSQEEFLIQLMHYMDVSHQALLHPCTVFFDKKSRHVYLCFERGDGDILANCVQYGNMTQSDTHTVVKCVVEGLQALHSKKVLHGEINPYSILRQADGSATLLTPDLSCRPIDRAKNKVTTQTGVEFMAPEVTSMPAGLEPTGVVDMYSLGVLIFFLSCPADPVSFTVDGSLDVSKLPLMSACSLVKSLTAQQPSLRPSADMVLSSHYILLQDQQDLSAPGDGASAHSALSTTGAGLGGGFALSSTQLPPVNLQQPPPPLPTTFPSVSDTSFSSPPLPTTFPSVSDTSFSSPPLPTTFPSVSDTSFSSPHSVDFCGPLPVDSLSRYTTPPPVDTFSSRSVDPQAYVEPNGSSSLSRNAARYSPAGGAGDAGFEGASGQFMALSAGGFEEAALQQEKQEKESRGSAAQFMGGPEPSFPMPSGEQGQFEIGTFSIQDVNGATDNSKGRKITRQPSAEDFDDADGDDEWVTDDQNED